MTQGGLKKSITWIQGTALTIGAVLGAVFLFYRQLRPRWQVLHHY